MSAEIPPRRILVTHAAPEAVSGVSRTVLARLGYALMTPEEFAESPAAAEHRLPDLRLVDERRLAELPEDSSSAIPIIVLAGRHGVTGADSRIAGAIRRPAGLHELYRLVQEVLEDTPRATLRVATHLKAVCSAGSQEWRGVVLSLSETGCLLRSPEPQLLGSILRLDFVLPRTGKLGLDAEVTYQLLPDLGMTFHATSPSERESLREFIQDMLTE
jgi:hypothetical protein